MAIRNSDKSAFWDKHLVDFRSSGLSRVEYCREHGLKVHQLGYQLNRAGKTAKARAKSAFARVVVPKQVEAVHRHGSRLVFRNGIALEFGGGVDATWIAKIITEVGGAS